MTSPTPRNRRTSEVQPDEMLSGHAYLWVQLKDDNPLTRPAPGRVRIRKPRNCDHGITICTECADSWGIDYEIDFKSTIGGRKMKEAL